MNFSTADLTVKIKRLMPEAKMPTRAHDTDAGWDLTAISRRYDEKTNCWTYGTGLAMEIPAGWCGLVFPRSSVFRTGTVLSNCVGVIDAGYRGEVMAKFYGGTHCHHAEPYKPYERIMQILFVRVPSVEIIEADVLSETERGEGGYGSSGR